VRNLNQIKLFRDWFLLSATYDICSNNAVFASTYFHHSFAWRDGLSKVLLFRCEVGTVPLLVHPFIVFQVPMYMYGICCRCGSNNLAEPTISVDLHRFCIAAASRSNVMLHCCSVYCLPQLICSVSDLVIVLGYDTRHFFALVASHFVVRFCSLEPVTE